MGIRFTKIEDNRKILMEKASFKRMEYLDKIREFRDTEKNIIYMDDSYISQTKRKSWSDGKKKSVKKPILKG